MANPMGAEGPAAPRGTRRQSKRGAAAAAAIQSGAVEHQQPIDVEMMELDSVGKPGEECRRKNGGRGTRGQSADFPLPEALPGGGGACHGGGLAGVALPRVSLPLDDSLDETLLPLGLSVQHALQFQLDYEAHNREVLDCVHSAAIAEKPEVIQMRLHSVHSVWARFWGGGNGDAQSTEVTVRATQHSADPAHVIQDNEELLPAGVGPHHLTPMRLDPRTRVRLCSVPQLQAYVQRMDLEFYQLLVDQLLPDPLRSAPSPASGNGHHHHHPHPNVLLPHMRLFARSLVSWMDAALSPHAPAALRELKLACTHLLANTIMRLSAHAHLALTARQVLHNDEQMGQMHEDFAKLDFAVLHAQAEWCCDWSEGWLLTLEEQFGAGLAHRRHLDQWADWLDALAARAIDAGVPSEVQLARGKRLLLSWTFWSSLVLRDFTLREAPSFGHFHLIRLLFDEYLHIAVERRLAKLCGGLPSIALMAPEWLRQRPSGTIAPLAFSSAPLPVHMPPALPAATTPAPQQCFVQQQQAQQLQYHPQQQQPSIQHPRNPFADALPPPGPEPPLTC